MTPSTTYVSEDRTVLVRVYQPAGEPPVIEVATRDDTDGIWSPPVRVAKETP